jgi:hypothetical protein
MSKHEKSQTEAGYVKQLSLEELRAIRDKREGETVSPVVEERAALAGQIASGAGVVLQVRELAKETGQSVGEFVRQQQSRFRQTAIDLSESEFCLEPDEVAVLVGEIGELPLERREHFDSCELCKEIVHAAGSVGSNCEDIGAALAGAAAQCEGIGASAARSAR